MRMGNTVSLRDRAVPVPARTACRPAREAAALLNARRSDDDLGADALRRCALRNAATSVALLHHRADPLVANGSGVPLPPASRKRKSCRTRPMAFARPECIPQRMAYRQLRENPRHTPVLEHQRLLKCDFGKASAALRECRRSDSVCLSRSSASGLISRC